MKINLSVSLCISILLIGLAVLIIALWYFNKMSIYGLVFGVFALILAAFVYHFGKTN